MNPLSIFNGASRAAGTKDEGFVSRDDAAQDNAGAQRDSFAAMLNQPSPSQSATTQQARSQPAKREAPASRKEEASAPAQDDAPRAQGQDDRQARPARAEQGARKQRASGETSETSTEPAATASEGTPQADNTSSDTGTWPPPGLGGFGLMLLQPAAPAPAPDAAALAANAANPLLAGLPTADGTATAAMPSALPTGASAGAIALPGLAGAATTPAATAADDAADLAALTNAAAAATSTGAGTLASDGDTPAIDSPAFVLPTLPHTPTAARAQDAPAVFSASPTPTPDLNDGFDEAVGTRLTWLAEQKIGHAHIKITPNDLGPVEVRLQMDGDKVHASFTAAHVETRQALEQSLPRLRDMLGEHGFQLAHADVGAQQQGQRQDGSATSNGFDGLGDGASEDAASVVVPASVLRARGLLDAYA